MRLTARPLAFLVWNLIVFFPEMEIKKFDDELRIAYGEIYVPYAPDSDGDFMTEVEIRKMAYGTMLSGMGRQIDVNHDHHLVKGAFLCESFIAREGDPDFVPGAWVGGVHVPDVEVWGKIKSGELNGFSIEASVTSKRRKTVMDLPEYIVGQTSESQGHTHKFRVTLSEDGRLSGGTMEDGTGHRHKIARGTVTEDHEGHKHKFSFVEQVPPLRVVA